MLDACIKQFYNNKTIRTKNTNDTVSLFESGVYTGLPFDGTINNLPKEH